MKAIHRSALMLALAGILAIPATTLLADEPAKPEAPAAAATEAAPTAAVATQDRTLPGVFCGTPPRYSQRGRSNWPMLSRGAQNRHERGA